MKKLFAIVLVALAASAVLVGCTDGKCDECGAPKAELTEEAKEAGLSKEFCKDCMNELLNAGTYNLNDYTRVELIWDLYEKEGSPEVEATAAFEDVEKKSGYSKAVTWAKNNGIINGHENGTFAPYETLNKEQFAVILYRYAKYKNIDVSAKADLSAYEDGATVLEYSVDAMEFAVAMGLVEPESETVLDPKGAVIGGEVEEALAKLGA